MLKKIGLIIIAFICVITMSSCQQNNIGENNIVKYDIDGIPVTKTYKTSTSIEELKRIGVSNEIIEKFGDIIVKCSKKNYSKIDVKRYSFEDLETILWFEGNIFELDRLYKIELIKLNKLYDEYYFSVRYYSNDMICDAQFDLEGNVTRNSWNFCNKCDKTSDWINNIKSGYTKSDIKKLDQTGKYHDEKVYDYISLSMFAHISLHCTTDGYFIEIFYDSNEEPYTIESINIYEL